MPSIIPEYEYDIFISYRQNDNKRDGWVTEFVHALKDELDATYKEKAHIYFDENPKDGLQESHDVDRSLEKKLKCVLFIPIISLTYCDINCFAWQQELIPFINNAANDAIGMNIQLPNGNVASRILPVKIHDIDSADEDLLQEKTGSVIRSIDFIYKGSGVNRPLRLNESQAADNIGSLTYRNQLNKVAMAIKDRLKGAIEVEKNGEAKTEIPKEENAPIGIESFGEKIKKRDLLKVGLVYAIISLVLWKTINLSIIYFSIPDFWSEVAIIALLAMLPVALLMAWLFERGPTGFIMTSSLAAKNNPYSGNKKKPLTGNSALLSLIIIMLVLYFLPQTILKNRVSTNSGMLNNKSIAVLYFDNMSGDPEQEYFSDGITEEIIARLTKIDGIRVISRTSTRVYKGQPLNLKKIAKELNVSAVLEGSFRRAGNKIKVTAQLIDAETDEHIWAETFTRELKDVFQVQSEIAHEIAAKFEVDITPEIDLKVSEIPTKNIEAYEYFLRGKYISYSQYFLFGDSLDFVKSKTMFERAIELDPQFGEAYAGLGDLYDEKRNRSSQNRFSEFTKQEDSLRYALSNKAIQLAPNSSFVNNARAYIFLNRQIMDFDSGFYFLKRAWEIDANDAYNVFCLATFYSRYIGLHDESDVFYKRAIELSPLDHAAYVFMAHKWNREGDLLKADSLYAISRGLRRVKLGYSKFEFYVLTNKFEEALKMIKERELDGKDTQYWQTFLMAAEGKVQEAQIVINEKQYRSIPILLKAELHKRAIERLKNSSNHPWNRYPSLLKNSLWDPYREDADFKELLGEAKLKYDSNLKKYGPFVDEFLKEIK